MTRTAKTPARRKRLIRAALVVITGTAVVTGMAFARSARVASASPTGFKGGNPCEEVGFSAESYSQKYCLVLTPTDQSVVVGGEATLTAAVTGEKDDHGYKGIDVTFEVTSGPNEGVTGTGTTDKFGVAEFSYTGTKVGTDEVTATIDDHHKTVSATATVEWTAKPDTTPKPGYWMAGTDGGVFSFGGAKFLGNLVPKVLQGDIVELNATAGGQGYWLVGKDGGVFAFGDATFFGNARNIKTSDVMALAHMPDGKGYWLASTDGNVYAFGDAVLYGNARGDSSAPFVALESTPTGKGYYLVNALGHVIPFGDAIFYGDIASTLKLQAPITDLTVTPSGLGYWMVGADGGVFAFGDAKFHGNMVGTKLQGKIIGLTSSASGAGYWMVGEDGGVFSFGDAKFLGNMVGSHLRGPVVDVDYVISTT